VEDLDTGEIPGDKLGKAKISSSYSDLKLTIFDEHDNDRFCWSRFINVFSSQTKLVHSKYGQRKICCKVKAQYRFFDSKEAPK